MGWPLPTLLPSDVVGKEWRFLEAKPRAAGSLLAAAWRLPELPLSLFQMKEGVQENNSQLRQLQLLQLFEPPVHCSRGPGPQCPADLRSPEAVW